MHRSTFFLRLGLFVSLTVACSGVVVLGQDTGTITGEVRDQTGAVAPDASVTATNVATGIQTPSKSGNEGIYTIQLLPVGTYSITTELAGFKQSILDGINLDAGQIIRLNINLQVGASTERVEVSGSAPLIQTESATLSTVIDHRRVVDLPLNGRSFMQLTSLMAGTNAGMPNSTLNGDFQAGGQVSANGQRSSSGNNYTLNGVSDEIIIGRYAAVRPSIDAIQEFDMEIGQYSASRSMGTGAQIDLVLKSGTNDWHGSAFEFLRNDAMDANDFFRNRSGLPRAPFKRNQFGGVISGPIIHNKTFFLFNYEGLRLPSPATNITRVPTSDQLKGNFSSFSGTIIDPTTGLPFPGNIIPTNRINPASTVLAQFWPGPNSTTLTGANNYINTGSNHETIDGYIGKIDHEFSAANRLSVTFALSQASQTNVPVLPFFATTQPNHNRNVGLVYTHVFSPTVLLELRGGFSRNFSGQTFPKRDPTKFSGSALGIPTATNNPATVGVPQVSVSTFAQIGDASSTPYRSGDNVFQYKGDLHRTSGKHNLSTGAEFFREQQNQFIEYFSRGFFGFDGRFTTPAAALKQPENALADFLLGIPAQVISGSGSIPNYQRSNLFGVYVQDDYKVTRTLAVNLGLRYDLHTMPYDIRGLAVNFDPATGKLFGAGERKPLVDGDHNNFAPRIGFAWQPFGNGNTVIRGGGGIYYDHVEHNQWTILSTNPPTYFTTFFTNNMTNPFLIDQSIPTATLGLPFLIPVDLHIRTAYNQQWSLNVQRQFGSDWSIAAGYVGSSAHKLPHYYDLNEPIAGPGDVQARRPYQDFTAIYFWSGEVNASYNALQVQVQKRYSHGVTLLSAYTWSKTIDSGSFSTGNGGYGGQNSVQNVYDRGAEKGPAAFDTPHRWINSLVWDLPGRDMRGLKGAAIGGWEFSAVHVLQSGYPFSVYALGDTANNGDGGERANLIGNPRLSSGQSIEHWFNTAAFSNPPDFTFGNSGRNILRTDRLANFDLALMKNFNITERQKLQLRGEFFNAFNGVYFGPPGTTVGLADFGVINSQANTPRQIQVALKYSF
jgi:hypothetical protein